MLVALYVIGMVLSFPIICDFLTDIFFKEVQESFEIFFEPEPHWSFFEWFLSKAFKLFLYVAMFGTVCLLTFIGAIFFGWLVTPIYYICNFRKFIPSTIKQKLIDKYRKETGRDS
jgi:hypothetical protein